MDAGFLEALVKAGSMILVSEIGDKTFFVAALLAMRQPRRWVLLGSLSALWLMTILSSLFGWAAPSLLPRAWTHVSTTLLFFLFGLRSLWDGLTMDAARASDELKEVEQELDKASIAAAAATAPASQCKSNGVNGGQHEGSMNGVGTQGEEESKHRKAQRLALQRFFSPAFLQAFSLVFLGEWGDKSQLATIGLASEASVWGVALGGCLGHAVCSGAAVIGGRHLASRISERTRLDVFHHLCIGNGLRYREGAQARRLLTTHEESDQAGVVRQSLVGQVLHASSYSSEPRVLLLVRRDAPLEGKLQQLEQHIQNLRQVTRRMILWKKQQHPKKQEKEKQQQQPAPAQGDGMLGDTGIMIIPRWWG
ncbi:unnamed protein product [Closterium sp. Yama58-4]|nr:unnamed protein product [Closterium sp. Yama58-4]